MPGERDISGEAGVTAQSDATPDPRRYLRVPIQVDVLAGSVTGSRNYGINLSSGGMCMQSAGRPEVGDQLTVRFCLDPSEGEIVTHAKVVWVTLEQDRAPGMTYCEVGLRFVELEEDDTRTLCNYVDSKTRYCEADEPKIDKPAGWAG